MSNELYAGISDTESADDAVVPDDDLIKAVCPVSPRWPLFAAASIAVVAAAISFGLAYHGGVAFGPWQGAYLDPSFPYRAPLLSIWVARAFAAVPFLDRAVCTVIASMAVGALACGALAVLAAQAVRDTLSAAATAVCGGLAGSILAMTPIWARLCTAASPAPLTVLFALAGIGFLQHAIRVTAPRWLVYSGALLGLASANDPSFAIVFLIALLAALGELGERIRVTRIFAPLLGGFCAAAAVPLIHSFLAAESLAEFLVHAMNTAFPAIGDGAPQFGFGLELRPQFSWPVLGATLAGMTALFMRGMRGVAVTWGMVFLAMGPFWPSLTNQHGSPYVLRDTDAASCMAYAAVCIAAGWGIAWMTRVLARSSRSAALPAIGALIGAATLVTFQVTAAPAPDPVAASRLGRGILEGCNDNAALVVGDPRTASLLRTLQIACGVRRDVTIIPVHALEQTKWRDRLHRQYEGALAVPGDFPPLEAWKRWPLERPNEFAILNMQMKLGGIRDSDFRDLMLWEFMRDNFTKHSICFAGVSSSWLTARGIRDGVLLRYPREGVGDIRPIESLIPVDPDPRHLNPELDKTVVALLLPLAEASRRQADTDTSSRIASLACAYAANDADAWLASARAAARRGEGKRAEDFAVRYISLAAPQRDIQVFLDCIKEDLRRNTLASAFKAAELARDDSDDGRRRRKELASKLWELDEIAVLFSVYSKAIESGPGDLEALYEGAAADVQLGNFQAARDRLGRAAEIDPMGTWSLLQTDGRFLLLEVDTPTGPGARNMAS